MEILCFARQHLVPNGPKGVSIETKTSGCTLDELLSLTSNKPSVVYIVCPDTFVQTIQESSYLTILFSRSYGHVFHALICSKHTYERALFSFPQALYNQILSSKSAWNRVYWTLASYPLDTSFVDTPPRKDTSLPGVRFASQPTEHHSIYVGDTMPTQPNGCDIFVVSTGTHSGLYEYSTPTFRCITKRPLSSILTSYEIAKELKVMVVDTEQHVYDICDTLHSCLIPFSFCKEKEFHKQNLEWKRNQLVLKTSSSCPNHKLLLQYIRKLPPSSSYHMLDLASKEENVVGTILCDHFMYLSDSSVTIFDRMLCSDAYILSRPISKYHVGETGICIAPFFSPFVPSEKLPTVASTKLSYCMSTPSLTSDLGDVCMEVMSLMKGFTVCCAAPISLPFVNVDIRNVQEGEIVNPCTAMIVPTVVPMVPSSSEWLAAECLLSRIEGPLVGVHTKMSRVSSTTWDVCDEYYVRARQMIGTGPVTLVCLGDTPRPGLIQKDDTVVHLTTIDPVVALFVLMQCPTMISSSSTFSWCAAALGKHKMVICPQRWCKAENRLYEENAVCDGWTVV